MNYGTKTLEKPDKPFATGLTLNEALNTALKLSVELTTETALAYRRAEEMPGREDARWAVVVTGDCDEREWTVAGDLRYHAGHSHPDNPWQVHLKAFRNPYQ